MNNTKPMYNGILQDFLIKHLPKTNKCYHKKGIKINLTNLKPNSCIFYYAAEERDFTKSILTKVRAYNKFTNSGVARTDDKGNTVAYLRCPQLYLRDGVVYERHIHLLYWDDKLGDWDLHMLSLPILCDVDDKFVMKYMKKSFILDACSDARSHEHSHERNHQGKSELEILDRSISIPDNKRWTEKMIMDKIGCSNKLAPIILINGRKLYIKLNKLGFYNTMNYESMNH